MQATKKYGPLAFLLFFLAASPRAHGDITVFPVRVIFSDRGAIEETVSLVNSTDDTQKYRLSFLHYGQSLEKGLFEVTRPSDAPDIKWADRLLRLSPQNVALPPKAAQTVRVQARLPANLPPGEYRTHLVFTGLPKAQAPHVLRRKPTDRKPVRMAVNTIFRVAIPVIIWRGPLTANISLREISYTPKKGNKGEVIMTIVREGERSVFGTVKISFLPYKSTEAIELTHYSDLAVYHPNTKLRFIAPLEFPKELEGQKGRLIVSFYDPKAVPQIRAEESIEIF